MLIAITLKKALHALPARALDDYKGLYGHVFVLGGAPGMSGAVRLAGEAALRVGAGKVSVATAPEHAHVLNLTRPELMCYPIQNTNELIFLNRGATHWLLGPGMGHSPQVQALMATAVTFGKPMVIDADGLHWLAQHPELGKENLNWVLTPHPGEAAALLGCSTQEIQQDRVLAVNRLQEKWGGVIILKGAGTLVSAPESPLHICPVSNPVMATAGMGDVLSGMIAGLMAQQMPPLEAALLATIVHAEAAERACEGVRGLLASDLFKELPPLLNSKLL